MEDMEEFREETGTSPETEASPETDGEGAAEAMRQLQEMNRKLREENERLRALPLKERLYEKVHVSVRTLDIFIGCMCVLFVIVVVLGMING